MRSLSCARAQRPNLINICLILLIALLSSRSLNLFNDDAIVSYFIQIAPSNIHLLPRLLNTLYHPQNHYALHYDLKIPPNQTRHSILTVYRALSAHALDSSFNIPNLYVVPSEPVTYRGITMTLNYFTGIAFLLSHAKQWHYFVNLSAADYPTASQSIIRRLLGQARRRNFIEWKPPVDWLAFTERRLGHFYIDTALALSRPVNHSHYLSLDGTPVLTAERTRQQPSAHNPLPQYLDYTMAKSSGWFILSKEFCSALMLDPFARKVTAAMSFSDASDEHLFATVLWNHANWRETTVPTNFRNIFFVAPNGTFAMGNDGVRSRQHPFWVDETDSEGSFMFWDELQRNPGFFTRKVRDTSTFRDRVDSLLIGLDGRSRAVKDYESRLTNRFQRLVRRDESVDVFGNTVDS